jgi:hypothetical protein
MQIHVRAKRIMEEGLVKIYDKKLFDQIAFYRYEETGLGRYKLGERKVPRRLLRRSPSMRSGLKNTWRLRLVRRIEGYERGV